MTEYAKAQGFDVLQVFEERGVSGRTAVRPALQEMLRFCGQHKGEVHSVLVYDYSRFARNTETHLVVRAQLKSFGVRLISITQPVSDDPMGKFFETVLASVAQLDNDNRAHRTKVAMQAAVDRGRWVHQAPIGFRNCGRNASPSLERDPERAALVVEAFDRVAAGEEPTRVHSDVVAQGLTTTRGGLIARTTFYAMLRSEVYVGRIEASLGSRDGDWEPLVSAETWRRVQAAVSRRELREPTTNTKARPRKRLYRRLRPEFELRRFLRCAECSKPLTGGVVKGHAYMNCPKGHVRARADQLTRAFQEWLARAKPSELFMRRLERAIRSVWNEQIRELKTRETRNNELSRKLRQQLQNLDKAYLLDRACDVETYREQRQELRARLEATGVAAVRDDVRSLDLDATIQFARTLLQQPERWWTDARPEDKVRLQNALFPQGLKVDPSLNFITDPKDAQTMSYMLFGSTGTVWRPQRDSNPCFGLERATSWASGRWGPGGLEPESLTRYPSDHRMSGRP